MCLSSLLCSRGFCIHYRLKPVELFLSQTSLLGMQDKLQITHCVYMSAISPLQCAFSHGGHLFAAANTNLIQLFSTFSFENTGNLKGHNGKVSCTYIHSFVYCTLRSVLSKVVAMHEAL